MPNLVPEKRVDRNGRAVTRHVLAPGTASKPLKQFPNIKPLTDLTKQVIEFQKLNFLIGVGTLDDLNQLYPVAGTIAHASEVCDDKETIRDLYRNVLHDENWVDTFAATCHFIAEAGGARDPEATQIAVQYAAKHYGTKDLLHADASTQQKVIELATVLKDSQFVNGVIGHGGSQQVNIKRQDFLNYLCSRIDSGTLRESMSAIKDLDGFLNFWDDEQEEPDVVANLDYIELVELMEYTRKHTSVKPESVLDVVSSHRFKAGEVRELVDSYEGFSALIEGTL